MKLPVHFYKPLAIGAPQPLRELPVRPERMIHFFPPHIDKIRTRIPETAKQVDVLCGNLEDAIPVDAKEAARTRFIEVARATDFGDTALWTRVNALNSPWFLDDITEIVKAVGNKLDVIMIPKVEGPWDIHFVDQYLALLEARYGVRKPILVHALLETAIPSTASWLMPKRARSTAHSFSRTCGTTPSQGWLMPVSRMVSVRSMGHSAI